ncbi:hypothetical protein BDL97_02G154000 [Sphagnum fallax]|nr:hypothetical protein BDL97_02G154000 [Sphagnum fallax]
MAAKVFSLLLLPLLLLELIPCGQASIAVRHRSSVIWERALRQKMLLCYQDIDSGLWGSACKASAIEKENCALRCLSPTCYESIYGADPLEEGEIDLHRGRYYKICIRHKGKGERVFEGVGYT